MDSKSIEATPLIGCKSEKIAERLDVITNNSLSSTPRNVSESIYDQIEKSLKRPFEVLAASSLSTSDFMARLTQIQTQNNSKDTK